MRCVSPLPRVHGILWFTQLLLALCFSPGGADRGGWPLPSSVVTLAQSSQLETTAAGTAQDAEGSQPQQFPSAMQIVVGMVKGFTRRPTTLHPNLQCKANCVKTLATQMLKVSAETVPHLDELLKLAGPALRDSPRRLGKKGRQGELAPHLLVRRRQLDAGASSSSANTTGNSSGNSTNSSGGIETSTGNSTGSNTAMDLQPCVSDVKRPDMVKLSKELDRLLPFVRRGLLDLLTLQDQLADQCAKGRSLDRLHLAEEHLRELNFTDGQLLVRGANILIDLEDAVTAFKANNFERFGEDIGTAWRKVLLAQVGQLPSGQEWEAAIRQTSEGLVLGFFGPESKVDAKTCLAAENMRFFAEIWDAAWLFFEQLSAPCENRTYSMSWKDLVGVAMVDLPEALDRCGGEEEVKSLGDVMKFIRSLDLELDPKTMEVKNKEMTVDLAQAEEDWKQRKWESFGQEIGHVLKELILCFPHSRLYSNDDGTLERQISPGEFGSSRGYMAIVIFSVCGLLLLVSRGWSARRRACETSACVFLEHAEEGRPLVELDIGE